MLEKNDGHLSLNYLMKNVSFFNLVDTLANCDQYAKCRCASQLLFNDVILLFNDVIL